MSEARTSITKVAPVHTVLLSPYVCLKSFLAWPKFRFVVNHVMLARFESFPCASQVQAPISLPHLTSPSGPTTIHNSSPLVFG